MREIREVERAQRALARCVAKQACGGLAQSRSSTSAMILAQVCMDELGRRCRISGAGEEASVVTYAPVVAAALSGATLRQLSYWRSSRSSEGPLLAPRVHRPRTRVSYSFLDVLALRTFVFLRAQDVPLQHVRKAVRSLGEMGETKHLSAYRLVAVGREVVWKVSDESAVGLTRHPGHQVIAAMVDILAAFRGARGRDVVPLLHPKPGVEVDPEVRGGYPVLEGTRVPYDLVAALLQDGLAADDVSGFYSSVWPEAARGALDFARYVEGYRGQAAA